MIIQLLVFGVFIVAIFYFFNRSRRNARLAYIENFRFNSGITRKIQEKYPHLTDRDVELVLSGLRDYFYICLQAKKRMVSMPSQVVDVAWHEFILFTRGYQSFCHKAFGRFLHHTPTEAMRTPTLAQYGIKRARRLACAKSKVDLAQPARLPLLFALDTLLNIPDGFRYSLDCKNPSSPMYGDGYCASHIGCSSGCAGSSGSDSGSFSDIFGGDSGGCSSGCGGGD